MRRIIAAAVLACVAVSCGRTIDSSRSADREDREGGLSPGRNSGGARAAGGASPIPRDSGQGGTGGELDAAAGGAAGAQPADAAPDAFTCESPGGGILTSASIYDTDEYVASTSLFRADNSPKGMVACGDSLCLMGTLGSRVHFERDLNLDGLNAVYLARLTKQGAPVWSTRLGGRTLNDRFSGGGLAGDAEGNVFVTGSCTDGELVLQAPGDTERIVECPVSPLLLVARFDAAGKATWVHELGTSLHYGYAIPVAAGAGGGVVTAAQVKIPSDENRESLVVVSWAADGSEIFRRTFDGDSLPLSIALDGDGNTVLLGRFWEGVTTWLDAGGESSQLDVGGSMLCAVKLDPAGQLLWSRCFGGSSAYGVSSHLALGPDGSLVMAGNFREDLDFAAFGKGAPPSPSRLSTSFEPDIYLARLDASGAFMWQRLVENWQTQNSLDVAVTAEGTILLPGTTRGEIDIDGFHIETANDTDSPFVAGFDLDGRALFAAQIGRSADAWGEGALVAGDCRRFYLASDYRGDLLVPSAPDDRVQGIVVLGGRY